MPDDDAIARVRAHALSLPDVRCAPCWGEEGFFHHPPGERRALFMTLKERVVSLPLPKEAFEARFGPQPARPRRRQRLAPEGPRAGPFEPHPVYAWRGWVRAEVLREEDAVAVALAVREAYDLAARRGRP